MATINYNRKILDLKRWEYCSPAPIATAAGHCIVSSVHDNQRQLLIQSNTSANVYLPAEDGFIAIPSPALAGTFGAGTTGCPVNWTTGTAANTQNLTATGGTLRSISTNQTLVRDIRGYKIFITGGPAGGNQRTVANNTIGGNSIIFVTEDFTEVPTTATTFVINSPSFYVLNAGTLAAGIFRRYDYATNQWITLNQTGLPATIGTDSKLISTSAWKNGTYKTFVSGNVTDATTGTLTNNTRTWTSNSWSNFQVRLVNGTGAGQIRTIVNNTSNTLVITPNWTVTPTSNTVYSIEGNDNFLYYIGNGAVTLYRYNISANTWATINPTIARPAAPGAGMGGHWIYDMSDDTWLIESNYLNGRYIYSFRGSNTPNLDAFDITSNNWFSANVTPGVETFGTGTKYAYNQDIIYLQKDNTGRWFRYHCGTREMQPWGVMTFSQGAAVVGDTAFDVTYKEGNLTITYIYMLLNSSNVLLRQMVI